MPVNDARVQQLINDALAKGLPGTGCCGRVEIAFRYLQSQRRIPGNSLDLDLAAAEHYMFSRWMVCTGTVSPSQMRALVIGYDAKKLADQLRGDPNREQTTANPVSPPDVEVIKWGLKGVTDGSANHDSCNKAVDPPLWRPIEEIFGQKPKSGY